MDGRVKDAVGEEGRDVTVWIWELGKKLGKYTGGDSDVCGIIKKQNQWDLATGECRARSSKVPPMKVA